MKAEYGPTLGRMLAPRWRAASTLARTALIGGIAALLAVLAAVALTLANTSYSHSGRVPFSFSYRGLYKATPEPGGYVRVRALGPEGELRYSFAVNALLLPPHAGDVFAELPLYADTYIRRLAASRPGFVLLGEGFARTSLHGLPGYEILYRARVNGQTVYGRDLLLLPKPRGVREGVAIVMLAGPNAQVTGPAKVAGTGVLAHPLKTFSFD